MKKDSIFESEIIDVLLGQASPEVVRQVRKARRANPEVKELYDRWAKIVPAMKEENLRGKSITQNVCSQLMEQLGQEKRSEQKTTQPVGAMGPGTLGAFLKGWLVQPGWKQALAGGAVAAVGILIAVYSLRLSPPPDESISLDEPQSVAETQLNNDPESSPPLLLATTYVEFLFESADAQGTQSLPFRTLEEGIAAVSPGGTIRIKSNAIPATTDETPRITKAIRLEAVGGSVRIGQL